MTTELGGGGGASFPPFRYVAALDGVPSTASYAAPPVAAFADSTAQVGGAS